jgi:chromosome segregation ATPase
MSAEERERDLLTAVALLQATVAAKDVKIEALESELDATKRLCNQISEQIQGLEMTVQDLRNAYENVMGIHQMNLKTHQVDRESWWRDRGHFMAEREQLRDKLSQLNRTEGDNEQLRREIRDLKERLLWAERR